MRAWICRHCCRSMPTWVSERTPPGGCRPCLPKHCRALTRPSKDEPLNRTADLAFFVKRKRDVDRSSLLTEGRGRSYRQECAETVWGGCSRWMPPLNDAACSWREGTTTAPNTTPVPDARKHESLKAVRPGNDTLPPLCLAEHRGLGQGEEHDLFTSLSADVMVQAHHLGPGDVLYHCLQGWPGRFYQLRSHLL